MTTTDKALILQDAIDCLGGQLPDVPLDTGSWVQTRKDVLGVPCGYVAGAPWIDADEMAHVTLVECILRHHDDWKVKTHRVPVDDLDLSKLRRCPRGEIDVLIEGIAQAIVHVRRQMTIADSAAERERLRETRLLPWFGLFVTFMRWADQQAAVE